MTRWLTGILLALSGLWPLAARAQGPWAPPAGPPAGYQPSYLPGTPQPQAWHNTLPGDASLQGLVPSHPELLYDTDSRFDLTFQETLARTWFRIDYLLWDISGPGSTLLGAPSTSTADLSGQDRNNRLPAIDPVNGPRSQTSAIVSDLGFATSDDINGIRGAIGIPTRLGTLEGDVWALSKLNEELTVNPRTDIVFGIPTRLIGAVTMLDNGAPSSTAMILFSENYKAGLQTTLFGTEGNWVFNPFMANVPVEVSPLLGFRYVRLRDELRIEGTDVPDPINAPGTALNHLIASDAHNHVFGPQIGLRAETSCWKFDFGLETKFVVGINRLLESVRSEQLFSATEDPQLVEDERTRFAPMFDLSLYGRFHFNSFFSLYAGYDLLVGTGFSRAYDNVVYNMPANTSSGSAIGLDSELQKFMAHGLMIGGELRFK